MSRYPVLVAALLAALTVGLVVIIYLIEPELADVLTQEDGVVESLQVGLFVVAGVAASHAAWSARRAGRSPVVEVLLVGLLGGLIIGEVDLDRVVFGRKIIYTRFLVDQDVWLGWRALAAVAIAGVPGAFALYGLQRRAELMAAGRRALGEPSGRLLLAALVLFGLAQVLERPLARIHGCASDSPGAAR